MSGKKFMWVALGILALDALITLPMTMMNTAFDVVSLVAVGLAFMLMAKDK